MISSFLLVHIGSGEPKQIDIKTLYEIYYTC